MGVRQHRYWSLLVRKRLRNESRQPRFFCQARTNPISSYLSRLRASSRTSAMQPISLRLTPNVSTNCVGSKLSRSLARSNVLLSNDSVYRGASPHASILWSLATQITVGAHFRSSRASTEGDSLCPHAIYIMDQKYQEQRSCISCPVVELNRPPLILTANCYQNPPEYNAESKNTFGQIQNRISPFGTKAESSPRSKMRKFTLISNQDLFFNLLLHNKDV